MSKEGCKCGCGGQTDASMQEQINDLQNSFNSLSAAAKFLMCGHPTLMLEDADDIAQFDFSSGWGKNCWQGWAICNGNSYYNPDLKKNIPTRNMFDMFPVGAGGTYAVGDTGGANTVNLTVLQLPSHNHGVTDPGHTHAITDPGHDHGVTDPGHNHSFVGAQHTHTGTTAVNGEHNHTYAAPVNVVQNGAGGNAWDGVSTSNTSNAGNHSHTFTTDAATQGGSIDPAFTGVDINNAFTGITNQNADTNISIDNTGGDQAHENRPPYIAHLFVKKIY